MDSQSAAQGRKWLREVDSRDLEDMHHALRMIVKHPMVAGEESRLFTNLADACWNEHVRRCAEESEDAVWMFSRYWRKVAMPYYRSAWRFWFGS